jgi:hypothetical protein
VGALLGGAIGHYRYDRALDAEETARRYGYHGDRGTELSIENVSVDIPIRLPPDAASGEYEVRTLVLAGGARNSRKARFRVR